MKELSLDVAYITRIAINTASNLSIVILLQPVIWQSASLFEEKDRTVSSACASFLVRLYYSVIFIHYEDFIYLTSIQKHVGHSKDDVWNFSYVLTDFIQIL